MTHTITSVLLRIICLKTLIPDLLNCLYYSEQILPYSQVNYLSQCRVKKLCCSEYPHPPPTPTFTSKGRALVKKAFNPKLNFVLNSLYGVILCIVFMQL